MLHQYAARCIAQAPNVAAKRLLAVFLCIGADCCERAVLVEDSQGAGLLITNGEFVGRWESKAAVTIEIAAKANGKVSLNNCSFWGPIERCVWMRGPNCQFTAIGCNFVQWDGSNQGGLGVASGVYFARLRAGDFEKTMKMMLMR